MWIIDDFLPQTLHDDLKALVMGDKIGWRFVVDHEDEQDDFYFVHNIISTGRSSKMFDDIKPVLYFMDYKLDFVIDNLLRINCKLTTNQMYAKSTTMHVDYEDKHYTGIYYINTCNGPTVIGDIEVESVANRFLLFDGLKPHYGVSQTDTAGRFNIVFNMQGHFRK